MTTNDDQHPSGLPNYGSVPTPAEGSPPQAPEGSYPPPPVGGLPPAPGGYRPQPQQNQKALWAMILGIVAIVGLCCTIGSVLGIPAIILGIFARKEVEDSRGMQSGGGMAIAGIATGAVALVGLVAAIVQLATGSGINGIFFLR